MDLGEKRKFLQGETLEDLGEPFQCVAFVERENAFNMEQFAASVNEFLTFRRYALLPDKGKVTREEADKKAEEEYRLFDPTQCIDSDFDKEIRGLFDVK